MTTELSFGRWLQQRRKALDLTQGELAQRVACARVTIQKLESGHLRPSRQIAERLVYHLAIPPEERATFAQWARQSHLPSPAPFTAKSPLNSSQSIPAAITPLIGRTAEIEQLLLLIVDHETRLLTLVGSPGIGKTRLSLELARQLLPVFHDGVHFISLASLRDPALLISVIAHALEVQEGSGTPILATLTHFLRDKHLLLLLDNFEHLVVAASALSGLLSVSPHLHLVVTSREVLHLYGEYVFEVPPLAVPDVRHLPPLEALAHYPAIELFVRRAQAVKGDFQLSHENAGAVSDLCTHLDGMPLAIELAVARIRFVPLGAMLSDLEHRYQWLVGGPRDAPTRQQTLHNTMQWSHALLSDEERRFFRRAGAFVGGFTIQAAEAVCNVDNTVDVWGTITSLVDKSLLRVQDDEDVPRFYMLETILQFAGNQLQLHEEAEPIYTAHAAYYATMGERAEPEVNGPHQLYWHRLLMAEIDNIRAALTWSISRRHAPFALQLAYTFSGMRPVTHRQDQAEEARQWLEQVMVLEANAADSLRAKVYSAAGTLAWLRGEFQRASDLHEKALHFFEQAKEFREIGRIYNHLGVQAYEMGNYDRAATLLEKSVRVARKNGDVWGIALALQNLGEVARLRVPEAILMSIWRGSVPSKTLTILPPLCTI